MSTPPRSIPPPRGVFRARILAAACAALALSVTCATAQEQTAPVITVFGEASLKIAPDIAYLNSGVTSDAKTAREAADANGRAMDKVLTALREQGVAETDIQTSRLSIQPVREAQRDANRHGAPRIVGFQAINQVRVTIRDISRISDILDRIIASGANDFSGLQFAVSEPAKHLDDIRAKAITDARHRAEIYARAAGADVGRPIAITEDGALPAPIQFRAAAPSAARAMPVAPGEEELRVSLNVTFELRR